MRKWFRTKRLIGLVILTLVVVTGCAFRYELAEWGRSVFGIELPENPRPPGTSDLEWCKTNYHDEITRLSEKHELPYEYLMSLIVLECSGNKPAGSRFEKHVYNQLKKVKEGKKRKFENIRQEHLVNIDDDGLKNLATSWGPFQLMGYKVIGLGVNVADIRNEETATELGVRWIKKEYGEFLEKEKFKDAFHIHNTGKRFPLSGRSKTHDPYYVSDGIKGMKYFKKVKANTSEQP